MKRDITVYSAAAWWRDSDPHVRVLALTAEAAEKAIDEAIREAAESAQSDEWCVCGDEVTDENADEHTDCGIDAQAWSGVHPVSLREQLDSSREYARRDILEGLRTSGVTYPETCY